MREDSIVLKRLKSKRRSTRLRFVVLFFFVLAMAAVYTYANHMYPWNALQNVRLQEIVFMVNDDRVSVRDGGVLEVSTDDSLRLVKVETTAPFEYGVTLSSNLFSMGPLQTGSIVEKALVNADWRSGRDHGITARYHRKAVGAISVKVKPTTLFWIRMAAATNSKEKSIGYFKEAEALDQDSILIKMQLAQLLADVGNLKEAARYYEVIAQKDPRVQWLSHLVALYREMGDRVALNRTLDKRAVVEPSKENLLEAAKYAEEILDWARAGQYYRRLADVMTVDEKAGALKRAGYAFISAGKPDEALSSYEEALKLDPKDINVYYNLAELYQAKGQGDRYAACLEKVLELDLNDRKTRIRLINHYENAGKFEELAAHLQEMLKLEPENAVLYKKLANVMEKLGRQSELTAVYEKLVKLEPENRVVLFNLGVLQFKDKKYKESAVIFEKLVRLQPGDEEVHTYLFEDYRVLGERARMIEEAKTIVSINPGNMDMYDVLFDELSETPQRDSLIPLLKKGAEASPDVSKLSEYLGLIYMEKNDIRIAITYFEKAVRSDKKNVQVLYSLAKLYESLPNLDKALEYYGRVLSIDDSYKDSKDAYLRLSMERVREEKE